MWRVAMVAGLVLLVACGRDGGDKKPAGETRTGETRTQGVQLNDAGREDTYADAGFSVFWPSGCGRLSTREPDHVDPDNPQEYQYACDRPPGKGRGCSVYALRNGRAESGGPPDSGMVVKQVESVLKAYGVKVERQRPLSAAGIEGVEVQAVDPAGKGEVWVRGLLTGADIYVLTAWDTGGGVFADPEIAGFFASFRVIP